MPLDKSGLFASFRIRENATFKAVLYLAAGSFSVCCCKYYANIQQLLKVALKQWTSGVFNLIAR